jgi:hypothetical protein
VKFRRRRAAQPSPERPTVAAFEIQWPDGWITAEPKAVNVWQVERVPDGLAVLVGALLTDGSNLGALVWPRGSRFVRHSPTTDWAIEERFDHEPLNGEDEVVIGRMWRVQMEALVAAVKLAEQELGGRPPTDV